jgi:hypothetical protein
MNKFRILYLLFLFFIIIKIHAQDVKFGWNIGSVNIYGDVKNLEFNGDYNILQFNWIIDKFSIGFNIIDIYDFNNSIYNGIDQYIILPIKLSYVPLNHNDWLFLSIYSKTGWQITKNINENNINHGIYSSIGIQLFIFPKWILYYSPYYSLFFEYDTHKKMKIGISLDLGTLIYFIGKSWKEKKEKEY